MEVVLLNESGVPLAKGHHMIVLTKTYLNEGVGVVIHESLIYLRCISLKGFCSTVGHFEMSCSRKLAWHVFLTLQMNVNVKNCIQNSPLKKRPKMIVVFIVGANYFQGRK